MPANQSPNTNGENGVTFWPEDIGILAIDMYFPAQFVDQTELEEYDGVSKGKYTIGLGQTRMGFCSDREDIHSLCLTVTKRLLEKTGLSPNDIGFLMVGTETLLDKSKSVKSVLMQLFEESGNYSIEGLDTTNACYGGTSALFHAVNWIESSSWDGRLAIVVAGDIAIYATGPARPTGGAGAVAMLIGPQAPIVLERGLKSTYMAHRYDFYKPDMASEYPTVDGKSTIVCYIQALDKCYEQFIIKSQEILGPLSLDAFDALVFHSPFCKLVRKSVGRLLFNEFIRNPNPDFKDVFKGCEKFRDLKIEETISNKELELKFIELSEKLFKEKTESSLYLATEVGNMYTASLYSCLVSYLISKPISDIKGKRVAMFSYGSGMAASMFSLKLTNENEPLEKIVKSVQDMKNLIESREKISPQSFVDTLKLREETHHLAPYKPTSKTSNMFPGTYYLAAVDEMYRRNYDRIPVRNDEYKLTPIQLKPVTPVTNGRESIKV